MGGFGLAAALGVVVVEGWASCPSPRAVSDRLGELLAGEAARTRGEGPDVARISADGPDELLVELRDPTGRLIAERRLIGSASCGELAAAAAAVIAAWESELAAAPLPSPSLPPPLLPSLPPGELAPPTPPGSTARPEPSRPSRAAAPPPANAARGPAWQLAGGFVGSFALGGGAFAAGGELVATVSAPESHALRGLGVRAAVVGMGERDLALGPGAVAWTRAIAGELAPSYRVRAGALRLDLHVGPAIAWLHVSGRGFPHVLSQNGWDVGIGAGLTAGLPLGALPLSFHVGLSGAAWLRTQTVHVDILDLDGQLPRFELALHAGLAFGRNR